METIGTASGDHPNLNLTPDEKRVYTQLLKEADPDGFGAVSGDVAVKFFERTKLPPDVLGQIWQIADTENRGFLTPAGFGVVLRLIGHAQAGRAPSIQLAPSPAPPPKFDGLPASQLLPPPPPPPPPQQQPSLPVVSPQQTGLQQSAAPSSPTSGPSPIRVPALTPEKAAEYSSLFEKSGAENGSLSGIAAKQIFERARLPNEILGRIWNLADTQSRGNLDVTEFVIAMHLLASYRTGTMRGVPNTLPPGLLEAASRKPPARLGAAPPRPGSATGQPIPQQFTGSPLAGRPQSPITRQQMRTPLSTQSTGEPWLINTADKQRFDGIFATVDTQGKGFITGEEAVQFFGNARLPEEILAQIWDLADINSDGLLNRDEFAVAMYLIRQHRGSRDGQMPQVLPTSLIPPSMRKAQITAPQSTAPAFEAAPVTKPRSAADDLFGLDVSELPQPTPAVQPLQVAQSTGGTDAGPFASPQSPPPANTIPPAPTYFKAFKPSSSFGQQVTGQTRAAPAPALESNLLDDNENEPSAKITNDAVDLGNLSNQVGNLTRQMGDLQTQRGQAEQEITQQGAQKRAFQEKLTQLRAAYDQEVQQVKSLKDQLAASQNETRKLQQEIAMIEGTHADLQTQHQQLSTALMTDQQENATLKEKMRQTNAETEQLKPQIEKLKSDVRQQKGLVAINRKQLATNEQERDRIKSEIAAAQKEHEEAAREAEESARQLEASHHELEQTRAIPMPTAVPRELPQPPKVASPTPSNSSNPFFRRQESGTVFSPPMGSAITSPEPQTNRINTFDSIFGPPYGAVTTAPTTSFSQEKFHEPTEDTKREMTPPARGDSSTPKVSDPPAPALANQIQSSALPFRMPMLRGDSVSSSVRVAPPASRVSPSHTPRALTPDTSTASPSSHRAEDPFALSAADEEQESVRQSLPRGETTEKLSSGIPGAFPGEEASRTTGVNPATVAIGAGVATLAAGAGIAAAVTAEEDKKEDTKDSTAKKDDFDSFFGGPSHKKTLSEQAADFDSAFASMGNENVTNDTVPKAANDEFPDIQELDDDDDDESSDNSDDEPRGFDDNFTSTGHQGTSSVAAGKQPETASLLSSASTALQIPPTVDRQSNSSPLPGFDQQTSPPDYKDAVPEGNPNHFPREYKNLLPEREDPTSPPPTAGGSSAPGSNPAGEPPTYGPEVGSRTAFQTAATTAPPTASAPFDFDSAFANMGHAPVEDDSGSDYEDIPVGHQQHSQLREFDPTFSSPAASTRTTNTQPTHSFSAHDAVTNPVTSVNGVSSQSTFEEFNSNPFPPSRSTATHQTTSPVATNSASTSHPVASNPASMSHDWDALFAPLDSQTAISSTVPTASTPLAKTVTNQSIQQATEIGPGLAATTTAEAVEGTPSSGPSPVPATQSPAVGPATSRVTPSSPSALTSPSATLKPERPQPGRALSAGTEHDDPILKRLTAMGWSRGESLAALEKFDYNIDKAADYLTFSS